MPIEEPPYNRRFVAAALVLVMALAAFAVPSMVWFFMNDPAAGTVALPARSTKSPAGSLTQLPADQSPSVAVPSPSTSATPSSPTPDAPTSSAPPAPKPPPAVANLRLVSNTTGTVTIAWDPADDTPLSHYLVFRDGKPAVSATVTTVRLDWARRGTQMLLQVAAVDMAGLQSEWRYLVIVPASIPAPTSAAPTPTPSATPSDPPSSASQPPVPTVTLTVTVTVKPPTSPPASPTGTSTAPTSTVSSTVQSTTS